MLNKPRLKQCFHLETLGDEGVFLLSERASIELNNVWHTLLLPKVDGERTGDAIVEEVLPSLLPEDSSIQEAVQAGAHAFYALNQMVQQGYITEHDDQVPPTIAAFCETLNVDATLAYHRLQTTSVAVKACGAVATSEFVAMLESLHIQVAEAGDLEVVLTDDYLQDGLAEQNRKALQANRPWMLIKPLGTITWIGPIFRPKKTACWDCLAHRLQGNRPIEQFIQRRKGQAVPLPIPLASLASTAQTTLSMAATEIFKWIVRGQNRRLEGNLVTYDALSLRLDDHIVVKRPQCPSCGTIAVGANDMPLPIVLGRRKKTFTTDGGHRCALPEETLRKYQHHIDPFTGVVRSLERVSANYSPLLHSYAARHHFAATFDNLEALRQNITGRSAGKGKTPIQARASAFCEAIERYSGVFQGDEIRRKSSYEALGDQAIHPNACMLFSSAQYDNRHEWNTACPSFRQRIPDPFDEAVERDWTPVWSLTQQDWKYVPTAYCYYGYPQATPSLDCWADTNGCASGNTLEEAILQGFLELVERDAVALWWYNQVQRPAVDVESFDDPYFQALKAFYQTIQRDIWVLDITSDLNIPTFAAISRRTDSPVEDIVLGYGTHFDPTIALGRALTEVNQSLPAVLQANADGTTQYLSYESVTIDWWKTATIENRPYLVANPNLPTKRLTDYPTVMHDDLLEDVKLCQRIVEKQGMELLVLDQTRPDIGLKVVKVMVPGLRHFWRRLAPGRLYDVPVQLGWLEAPLTQDQLNPFPMWM